MDIKATIEDKLGTRFGPQHLEVLDESHGAVNAALADELAGPVHALAIHAYTLAEWAEREGTRESPPCLGGG